MTNPQRFICAIFELITLVVLFHVEENWRGERNWQACRQSLEAKGERLDLAAYVPPAVPDDQNFAMTPFLAPLCDFKPGTQQPRDTNAVERTKNLLKLPTGPQKSGGVLVQKLDLVGWRSALQDGTSEGAQSPKAEVRSNQALAEAAPAVLEKLARYNPILDELRQASHRPQCRFNLAYESGMPLTIQMPYLGCLRNANRILQLRASAELALGQHEAACEDLKLMFYLADSMKNEPMLVSQLVRQAIFGLALQPLWEGLADQRWTEPELKELQTQLQRFEFLGDLKRAFQAERACACGTIEYLVKSKEPFSLLTNLGSIESAGLPDSARPTTAFLLDWLLPRGWLRMEQANYSQSVTDSWFACFNPELKRIYPRICEENERQLTSLAYSEVILHHRLFFKMVCPAVLGCEKSFAKNQTLVDQATIACGLERYRLAQNRFPDTLEALMPQFIGQLPKDIFSGEPIKYRRTDEGRFLLYSIGWNEKDDGGVVSMKNNWQDFDQGDWVWRYPQQTH